MLSRSPSRATAIRAALTAGLLLLAGCSSVPVASFPEFAEHHVAADFVVPAEGRLRLPVSTRSLVVQELGLEPAPQREQFDGNGARWLLYPAGTQVRVRCRFRAYAEPGQHAPDPAAILPGARRIEVLEGP